MNNNLNEENYKIILEKKGEKKPVFKRNTKSIMALVVVCSVMIGTGIGSLAHGATTDVREKQCSTYFNHDIIKDYINDPGEFETTIEALDSSVYLTDNGKALYDDIYIHNYLNFIHDENATTPDYEQVKVIKEDIENSLLNHFKETLKENCNLPEDSVITTYYECRPLKKDVCKVTYESKSANEKGEIVLSNEYQYVLQTIAALQSTKDKYYYCRAINEAIAANTEMDSVKLKQKDIRVL
ncbi:MAG: hypothetical protein ACI4OT_01515 [Bacilli bacterium]